MSEKEVATFEYSEDMTIEEMMKKAKEAKEKRRQLIKEQNQQVTRNYRLKK